MTVSTIVAIGAVAFLKIITSITIVVAGSGGGGGATATATATAIISAISTTIWIEYLMKMGCGSSRYVHLCSFIYIGI